MITDQDDMPVSRENLQLLLDTSYRYGKLFAEYPQKREEVRDRWEKFCESHIRGFHDFENFDFADQMRVRFNEGCFANYWG